MTDQTETVEQTPTFEDRVNDLVERLTSTFKEVKSITGELKALKREHAKIVKKASGGRRKKAKDPNAPKKAPSGFAKPTKITKELAEFLGLQEGDLIARPKAISKVSDYVKAHSLQDEKDGRIIHLDRDGGEVLATLLNIARDTELTYFNLQTYMKVHFPKAEKKAAETAVETETAVEAPATKRRTRRRAAAVTE